MNPSEALSALDAAESELQDALRSSDVDALDRLLHPDATYLGPDGVEVGRADDLGAHRSGSLRLSSVTELSRETRAVDQNGFTHVLLALVGTAGGEPLDATIAYEREWVLLDGRWQVLRARGTLAG